MNEQMLASDTQVDILQAAWTNEAFRRVVLTGAHGHGEARLDGQTSEIGPNDLVFVRAGTRHNFVNTDHRPLRLITVYAPPEHAPGTVHQTKAEADAAEAAEAD
jgi:oxalate decarboxylase/phosphoglucose isomerase-like protein (cupin superfamily)